MKRPDAPKNIRVTKKYCKSCERTYYQPYEYFHKHPRKRDGLQPTCKNCQREAGRRYKAEMRKKNPRLRYGIQGIELNDLVDRQIQHLREIG